MFQLLSNFLKLDLIINLLRLGGSGFFDITNGDVVLITNMYYANMFLIHFIAIKLSHQNVSKLYILSFKSPKRSIFLITNDLTVFSGESGKTNDLSCPVTFG